MKLTIALTIFSLFQVTASTYSQNTRLNLNFEDVTLETVFQKIEANTDYSIFYKNELTQINASIHEKFKDATITEVLNKVLPSVNLSYVIKDKLILIIPKNPDAEKRFQKIKVTGVVTDMSNGEPIIGANVTVEGTTLGTTTDIDGKYSIDIPNTQAVLIFSFIGYLTEKVNVGEQVSIDIKMSPTITKLDELVVIGYGSMRKKDLTGSITQIKPNDIILENPNTVQDILRGTAGLNVGMDASAKGGGSLQIRGQRSVSTAGGHNAPLLILDGMIFYGELSEINPDDIGQIDILKDASAAAIYGAKAANGVIIITTKKGKQGKPVVNFSWNLGLSQKSNYREVFGPEGYLKYRQDFYETRETYGVNPTTGAYEAYQRGSYGNGYFAAADHLPEGVSLENWRSYTTNQTDESDLSIHAKRLGLDNDTYNNLLAGKTFDWYKHSFRIGFNQDYNISVSGANDHSNYYFSMGYLKNEGVQLGDDYNAIRSNMKINTNVTKWFEVGANVNFQNRSNGGILEDIDEQLKNSPFSTYADEDGNPVQYPMGRSASQRGYNYDFQKKYLDLESGYTVLNSILTAKIKLPFNISYSFNAAPRLQWYYNRYFMSAELPDCDPATRGVDRNNSKNLDWSVNNTVNWDYTFADKHHVNLTLVQEAEEKKYWSDNIAARKIQPSDALGFHNTQNGTKENSSFSTTDTHETADALLARLFYSYDDRYMITTSLRRDGYSAFGSSNPYALFPSVALAWTITNEKFIHWQPLTMAKLRLSYGKNGNRSLEDPYVSLADLSQGAGATQGYIDASGSLVQFNYLMIHRLANPNLQWEKSASWNFGLDFGLWDNRVGGSIEYYNMNTNDMIMNQSLPSFSGFTSITTNLGQVNNRGVEISINTQNVKTSKLEWNTSLTFSYNKNEIKHLYYEYEDILDDAGNIIGTRESDDISNQWFIGHPINSIWNYKVTGIWQLDEVNEAAKYGQRPGDPKVANNYTADDAVKGDGSVTHVYNDKDKEFLGQTTPPIHWSLRNEIILWKSLTFSFNIYSYMGHKSLSTNYLNNDDNGGVVSYGRNIFKKDYWTINHPTNEYGRIEAVGPTGATEPGKLYNRSFIRLENISIGYKVPQNLTHRIGVDNMRIFGTIRNAAVWKKDWEYGDPETSGLAVRNYSLGLNLTF